MKIAYLTFERPGVGSGVGKKLDFQAECWRREGHEVLNFVLNTPPDSASRKEVIYLFSKNIGKPLIKAAMCARKLRSALKDFNPDVVYMRQFLWFPGLLNVLDGFCVIQEINSSLEDELKMLKGLSGSVKRMQYFFKQDKINNLSKGFVYVTGELALQSNVVNAKKIVISNGYVVNHGMKVATRSSDGRPSLIFVGSPGQVWHGLDKVIAMAEALPEFDFHMVVPGFSVDSPSNLYCHGEVVGEKLAELYMASSAAIGAMAAYRKNTYEGCSLKCREYAAYGLPIISGYKDTDLSGASFYLEIENKENNVLESIDKIREFVLDWRGRPFPYADAIQRIDAIEKEKVRLAFFKEVLSSAA